MTLYDVKTHHGHQCRSEADAPDMAAEHAAWDLLPLSTVTEPFAVTVTDPTGTATKWTVRVRVIVEAEPAEEGARYSSAFLGIWPAIDKREGE